jgi:hypothetical protein
MTVDWISFAFGFASCLAGIGALVMWSVVEK